MFEIAMQQLLVVAITVERFVQALKTLVKYNEITALAKYQKHIDVGLSVAVAIGLAFLWNVDVFTSAGLPPVFGSWTFAIYKVLTGVVAAFGGNVVHEIFGLLSLLRKPKE